MNRIPTQDPNTKLINLQEASQRFKETPDYSNNSRAQKMYNKYLNNEINISGYLHEKIYGEILDDTNRTLIPCIKQHIYLILLEVVNIDQRESCLKI